MRHNTDANGGLGPQPQRGYLLQLRVAASATLGIESERFGNRNAVAPAVYVSFL